MNTTINSNAFNTNVAIARLITNRRDATANPLYNTVRCTFDEKNMLVESNNINSSIRIAIPAEELGMVTTEGGSVLLTEVVCNWLSRVAEELSIVSEESVISMKSGADHFDFNMKSQDYQNNIFRELRSPSSSCLNFEVPAEQFISALRFCTSNAYPDSHNTSGIAFSAKNNVLTVYSYGVGGTKCCAVKLALDKNVSFNKVADAASLNKICRGLSSYVSTHNIADIQVFVDDKGMWFETGGIRVYTQYTQIQLLDWEVVENKFTWGNSVEISQNSLSRAVGNINSVAEKQNGVLKLFFDENSVKLYSPAIEENEVDSVVPFFIGTSLQNKIVKAVSRDSFVELVGSFPASNSNVTIRFEQNEAGATPLCIEYGPMKSILMSRVTC